MVLKFRSYVRQTARATAGSVDGWSLPKGPSFLPVSETCSILLSATCLLLCSKLENFFCDARCHRPHLALYSQAKQKASQDET
ncbi:Hypothetical protein NTJ_01832 [Nesidiocoris tenuis]|uniref:Uncharacterized protein n=1 Tax=Nesidiocoris tenuis TaxID=355587 RepID=A0ABN7ACY7_9HEMI|nr:Hypothetical protein NTJ_01832 [Nesidiocoris tenuis]